MNRQWRLARRPVGALVRDDFEWVELPIPEPREGELLIRNRWFSCDPTQRGWAENDTYLPAVRIGEVMRSFAVGEVVRSRHPAFQEGTLLQGLFGWQDFVVSDAAPAVPFLPVPTGVSAQTALSVLGNTGLAAYFGLLEVGRAIRGETIVVSAAAGATGSLVAQIAKIIGCRVVGIAGGAEKCGYLLDELELDGAIDYKSENVHARLRELCPQGIDVYFDNVGGKVLDAALARLALRGRVVLCGALAAYNDMTQLAGPKNYIKLLLQRGRMEGFIVLDYLPRAAEAIEPLASWLAQGKLQYRADVQHGFERAPEVLARLFSGENRGKLLLCID